MLHQVQNLFLLKIQNPLQNFLLQTLGLAFKAEESTDTTRMEHASSSTDLVKGTVTVCKGTEDTHAVSVIESAASSSLAEFILTDGQISFQEGLTIQPKDPSGKQLGTSLQADSSTTQSLQLLQSQTQGTSNYKDKEHDQQQASVIFCGPDDDKCLYWTITLAYLLPVKNDDTLFEQRYKVLFGNEEMHLFEFRTFIRNFNPFLPSDEKLANLVTTTFRNRVVDFMESNSDRFRYFNEVSDEQCRFNMRNRDICVGDPEMQAISLLLNCKINVDGEIYPVFFNHEETIVEPEITLMLFHMYCSNGNINHYFYSLEESLIDSYRTNVIDRVLKWLPKYCYKNSHDKMSKEHTLKHDNSNCKPSMNFLSDNSKKYKEYLKALENIPENSELLNDAFRLLKTEVETMHNNKDYDLVLEISNVKKVDSVINILLSRDSSDLDVLQFQRIVAQTKNMKGDYEDAIKILSIIKDKLLDENSDTLTVKGRKENIDDDKFYFSLLILSDVAYTQHLLGECKESYNLYKALYDKVIKHIDLGELSYVIYNKILLSDKYRRIISLNREYLSILHIRGDIAHELTCLASKEVKSLKYKKNYDIRNKALEYSQNALSMYEEILNFKQLGAEFRQDIWKTMLDIAFLNIQLGILKLHDEKNVEMLCEVINHYKKAFEMCSMALLVLKKEKGESCVKIFEIVEYCLCILYYTARTFDLLGNSKKSHDLKESLKHYKKALGKIETVHKLQMCLFGQKHEHTSNSEKYLKCLKKKLDKLKLRKKCYKSSTIYL